MRLQRWLGLSDLHCPFHDRAALAAFIAFGIRFRPDHLIIGGDFHDFYQISRFSTDPDREGMLQDDLDAGYLILRELRRAFSGAGIYWLIGNHEFRLGKYLRSQAPQLRKLRSLSLPSLFRVDEFGIQLVSRPSRLLCMAVKHGKKFGIYTPRWELDRNHMSGISFHSHRMGCFYQHTPGNGLIRWYMGGWMGDKNQLAFEYLEGEPPDWHLGFPFGYVSKDRAIIHLMDVVDGSVVADGEIITARQGNRG